MRPISKAQIDYSLCLVTSRDLLPPGKDYYEFLDQALQGGVTVVEIREKHADTAEFLEIAQRSQDICSRYNVPLIVNDRIDIALAIGADGVHLGQSDMPISLARKLLPQGTIIGISCNRVEHVKEAVQQGADYVGIGAIWATKTKDMTGKVIGVRNVGKLLQVLDGTAVKAVGIGGIKSTNALRTLYGTVSMTGHAFDGIAVVSDIMTSSDSWAASSGLAEIVQMFKRTHTLRVDSTLTGTGFCDAQNILKDVGILLETVRKVNPLVHQITNTVVQTQSANATLALGASPIMSSAHEEMGDLAAVVGSVLVNIGTLKSENREAMRRAGFWANLNKKPVILDPVGVGASAFREEVAADLLNTWQASVIKGNAGELATLAQSKEVKSKGVDSVGSGFKDPVAFVSAMARAERCPIILTGPTDYICDASGQTVVCVKNGHEILGRITGSGCIVGTAIAVFCAGAAIVDESSGDGSLVRGNMFLGAIGGVLAVTISAELAMDNMGVNGPGTFLPALLDELSRLTPEMLKEKANVEVVRWLS